MRNSKGQYVAKAISENRQPLGTIRIRTRHKRGGVSRYYIKIEHPNKWIEYARYVWIKFHGIIPRNVGIHHIDKNPLNDNIDNLCLVTKAEHIAIHRSDFKDKAIAAFVATRRRLKWSTKSNTKRNGRHDIVWSENDLIEAIEMIKNGKLKIMQASIKYNISDSTLRRYLKSI